MAGALDDRGGVKWSRMGAEFRTMRRLVGLDMDLHGVLPIAYGKAPKRRSRWRLFFYLLVTFPSFWSVLLFRVQVFLFDTGLRRLATFVSRLNHLLNGVAIGNGVRSTGALQISHGHVVLDGFIELGHQVQINPFVTLGVTNSSKREFDMLGPHIGNHVNIGTGAKILGPVKVGDYAKIGANAVVVRDVPAWHTAVGAPARCFPSARQKGWEEWEEEKRDGGDPHPPAPSPTGSSPEGEGEESSS